jgi:type I restriction enzyme M protein
MHRYEGDKVVLSGVDLVPNVARLCAMNLFLHGIGVGLKRPVIDVGDSLETPATAVDMVLTNPPFGKKSSFTIVGKGGRDHTEKLSYRRDDFWATTSNKQLNFVQHVYSMLKDGGTAAIVVPDNVLFEGGAGEKIRRRLLEECNVHTLLRLPTGIWYSPSVKANVLFFDKGRIDSSRKHLWIYDLRSKQHFSLRQNPISSLDLEDFVLVYCAGKRLDRSETESFRRFSYADLMKRDKTNLDISWRSEHRDSSKAGDAKSLMIEILSDLSQAMREFESIE